jgi:hypothetical protein
MKGRLVVWKMLSRLRNNLLPSLGRHENCYAHIFIFVYHNLLLLLYYYGLRHCSTSRKVAGSIPDAGIGIVH